MSSPISGFTAVPNPMMLSFMGSQSFIMMYEAGSAWQYGKRRISAMSNEEFNKLTPLALLEEHTALLRSAIPTIQKGMEDMSPLIQTIMVQFGTYIAKAIEAFPAAVGAATDISRGKLAAFGTTGALTTVGNIQNPFSPGLTGQELVNALVAAQKLAVETLPAASSPDPLPAKKTVHHKVTLGGSQTQTIVVKGKIIDYDSFYEQLSSEQGNIAREVMTMGVAQVATRDIQRQKAGRSQRDHRVRLIQNLTTNKRLLKEGGLPAGHLAAFRNRIKNDSQQLRNLQERYIF